MNPEILEHAERALRALHALKLPDSEHSQSLSFELGWLTGKVAELEQANDYLRSTIARLVDDVK